MSKTVLHIQHNTNLPAVESALTLFRRVDGTDVYEFAEYAGIAESVAAKLIFPALRQMGIIQGNCLAPFGSRLAALRDDRPELVGEAVHLRLATLHYVRPSIRFSLAYETLCDWLCERGDFVLSEETRPTLAGHVTDRAARLYEADPGSIAFSKSSVNGGMIWLRATAPPALQSGSDRFARRDAVSALSVLWAVDALYRKENVPFGTRLSLTEEREERLSRWLLLEPGALPANLSLAARTEGARPSGSGGAAWLTLGTEGGFGSWMLLSAPCPVGAMLPGVDDSDLAPLPLGDANESSDSSGDDEDEEAAETDDELEAEQEK